MHIPVAPPYSPSMQRANPIAKPGTPYVTLEEMNNRSRNHYLNMTSTLMHYVGPGTIAKAHRNLRPPTARNLNATFSQPQELTITPVTPAYVSGEDEMLTIDLSQEDHSPNLVKILKGNNQLPDSGPASLSGLRTEGSRYPLDVGPKSK